MIGNKKVFYITTWRYNLHNWVNSPFSAIIPTRVSIASSFRYRNQRKRRAAAFAISVRTLGFPNALTGDSRTCSRNARSAQVYATCEVSFSGLYTMSTCMRIFESVVSNLIVRARTFTNTKHGWRRPYLLPHDWSKASAAKKKVAEWAGDTSHTLTWSVVLFSKNFNEYEDVFHTGTNSAFLERRFKMTVLFLVKPENVSWSY